MNCFGTYFTHFTYVPQPGVGWGGGVGCNDMHCLHTCSMLRNSTCAHVRCYAIGLAHMFDATQLYLRTCSMLRNYTCAHVGCYAMALAHMLDATQLYLRTCSMLRNWTCAHVRCYAIVLARMFDATQLHLSTCWMLRNCTCAKECLQMSANFSKRGSSNGHGVLNSCVWTRICPSNSSSNPEQRCAKKVRNELVSSGLDFTKMGYRLIFYIKTSVLLTGASWRADQVVSGCFNLFLVN